MPLWAFWRILIWSFRSSRMLGPNRYREKSFIIKWKYLILAKKCLSDGIIEAVWFSLSISVSKFLDFVLSFYKMSWIVFFQAMNLGSVKLTHNVHVLYTHPKAALVSYNAPSEFSFDELIILSLGTSSFWGNERETAWISRCIAEFPLSL